MGPATELSHDPRLHDYQRRRIPVVAVNGVEIAGGPRPPYYSFHGNAGNDGSPNFSTRPVNVAGDAVYIAQEHGDASRFRGRDGQVLAIYVDTSKLVSFDARWDRCITR